MANHVGILEYDTWRYYINTFGCSHFKGTGIEDNYYLFRHIYLINGERVNSRKKIWLAHSENPLTHGTDYIIGDHQAAVSVAKFFFPSRTIYARRLFVFSRLLSQQLFL